MSKLLWLDMARRGCVCSALWGMYQHGKAGEDGRGRARRDEAKQAGLGTVGMIRQSRTWLGKKWQVWQDVEQVAMNGGSRRGVAGK